MKHQIPKPINRNPLRHKLGRLYFCLKRHCLQGLNDTRWAKTIQPPLPELVIEHQSFLLRPLKGVDMYLQHNKTTNLKIAITSLNNIVILPGETFSFWKLVGRPTSRKGYLDGLVLSNGTVGKGTGGGLCQLGNLIYWMVIHSPLTVTERWRHSYDVFPDVNRKVPFGSGATLSYNYVDLQIKNETDQAFQLNFWLTDSHLKGSIRTDYLVQWVYEVYEANHRFEQQWWGGFTRHNEIRRKIRNLLTNELKDELVTKNHAVMMYNPLIDSRQMREG